MEPVVQMTLQENEKEMLKRSLPWIVLSWQEIFDDGCFKEKPFQGLYQGSDRLKEGHKFMQRVGPRQPLICANL